MKSTFYLYEEHARNYEALQNFYQDKTVRKGGSNKRGNRGNHDPAGKRRALEAQGLKCADCDFMFEPDENGSYPTATRDHVIPARYGSALRDNKEYVCQPCNQAREKGDRLVIIKKFFGSLKEPLDNQAD